MENVLSIKNLSKNYGPIKAVRNLSLDIPQGSVFGILGPNGSGKTTTLGIILDVINPTSGTYEWFQNFTKKENRKKIGSILETPAFYPYLSAVQNLRIIADIKGIGYGNINNVLKTVGLYKRKDYDYRTYSLGMKQRLGVGAALLCDPKVMVLDEPTNGLDPQGIAEIRDIILKVAGEGRTVILASHILDEVQKVCTHFAVLNYGELMHTGSVDEVSKEQQEVELGADDMEKLETVLDDYPEKIKSRKENKRFIITLKKNKSVADLSGFIIKKGIVATHLVVKRKSLEQQFLDILNESK